MNHKIKMFFTIISIPSLYLLFFYVMWICRNIDQGRAVTGIAMTMLFGYALIYFAQGLVCINKKQWKLASLDFLLASVFVHLWYISLATLNTSLITKQPCPLASHNQTGWFGIEGFWGLGIVVPMYFVMIVISWGCFLLYDRFTSSYVFYNLKRRLRNGRTISRWQ